MSKKYHAFYCFKVYNKIILKIELNYEYRYIIIFVITYETNIKMGGW